MKKNTKKQLFAVFVLLVFAGSGIAYALLSVIPTQERQMQYVVYQPLQDSEEAYFLQRNIVVAKYFYSEGCLRCQSTEAIVDGALEFFDGNFFVEKINIDEYPDEAERLDITQAPTIYLKGYSIDVITENITLSDLTTKICVLFFSYVDKCSI